ILLEVDLPDGEVIRGRPVAMHPLHHLGRERLGAGGKRDGARDRWIVEELFVGHREIPWFGQESYPIYVTTCATVECASHIAHAIPSDTSRPRRLSHSRAGRRDSPRAVAILERAARRGRVVRHLRAALPSLGACPSPWTGRSDRS